MPLATPYAYIVCYDLKEPVHKYGPLFNELKNSHRWWHYLTSTWIVLRYESLNELQTKMVPLIYTNDRMIIMPAKGPANGWLAKDGWEWINNFVPKEW